MATQSYFYVTLFSNASRDIFGKNTLTDFTAKVAQPVDLDSTSNWEVGLCEISCSSLSWRRKAPPQYNIMWYHRTLWTTAPSAAFGHSSSHHLRVRTSFETYIMCPSNSSDFRISGSNSWIPRDCKSPSRTAQLPQRWWKCYLKRCVVTFNRTITVMHSLETYYVN